MKVIRAIASAALAGLVLVALAVPGTAIAADDVPSSGGISSPECYNYENPFRSAHARCKVERTFKPGRLGKNWDKVTFKYSIWVNDVRKYEGELVITGSSAPDSNGYYTRSAIVEPLGTSTTLKPCDTVEIVWDKAVVTKSNPATGKDEVLHEFLGGSGKIKDSSDDCSIDHDEETVSVTLPGGALGGGGVQSL